MWFILFKCKHVFTRWIEFFKNKTFVFQTSIKLVFFIQKMRLLTILVSYHFRQFYTKSRVSRWDFSWVLKSFRKTFICTGGLFYTPQADIGWLYQLTPPDIFKTFAMCSVNESPLESILNVMYHDKNQLYLKHFKYSEKRKQWTSLREHAENFYSKSKNDIEFKKKTKLKRASY